MATENLDTLDSAPAAADFTTKVGYGAIFNTSGQLALAGANAVIDGIIHAPAVAAEACRFISKAVPSAKLKAGGTITRGALLTTDANGAFVVATTGQNVLAKARVAAAAGDVFPAIYYGPTGRVAP